MYALCRLADDIVDAPAATQGDNVPATAEALAAFRDEVGEVLNGGPTEDPVLAAIGDSFARCAIPRENVDRFFGAMAQDLTTTTYETWDDLVAYMEGSAAVIGEMMLPVLRPRSLEAFEPARALGFAFQLTNFLRDVGEDLDRGQVYVPQEDLRRFGADPWSRQVTPAWRELMRFEIARNRELYAQADTGIPMLPPSSARCVATARELYARILELIEARDYDVFTGRARVASWSKATTSAGSSPPGHHGGRVLRDRIEQVPCGAEATHTDPERPDGAARVPSTWKQARPGAHPRLFDVAQSQDPGGWYVVGRSADVGTTRSVTRTVAGRELVLVDESGTLMAGPGTCPHLGALLDDCEVIRGDVVCRWHGMALARTVRPDGSRWWPTMTACWCGCACRRRARRPRTGRR